MVEIEFKCNKCGKLQQKNDDSSNDNFDIFDCDKKCECGGIFSMFINGQEVKGEK